GEALRSVETVIVDEIHALVPTKRGAHLALSLERLEALAGRRLQRIGLSATQRPLEEVARFLGGVRQQRIGGADGCDRNFVTDPVTEMPQADEAASVLLDVAGEDVADVETPRFRPVTVVNAG